jgi:rod shape-determining protein MreD
MIIPFFLALFALFFSSALFPTVKLFAFAPFLALVYTRKSFIASLWMATLAGCLVDLVTSGHRFGTSGLIYCLTTFLVYHQKRHFFDEKPLALALFTILISFVYTGFNLIAMLFSERSIPLSGEFFLTEFIGMPFLDAVYAFFWFTCPLKAYARLKRYQWKKPPTEEEVEE